MSVVFFGFALYIMVIYPVMNEEMLGSFDEIFENPAFKAFGKSVPTLTTIEGLLVVELYQWGIELFLAGYCPLCCELYIW